MHLLITGEERNQLKIEWSVWWESNPQCLPLGYEILSLMRFSQFRHIPFTH